MGVGDKGSSKLQEHGQVPPPKQLLRASDSATLHACTKLLLLTDYQ